MSKTDLIKPTTKESYAMPKSKTSNRFEVLGKIHKPNTPSSSNPVYLTKEPKLLIQVLEADHQSTTGSFELQKFSLKDIYFLSNEVSKTRRFYEFILVDTKFIQVSHAKNPEGTDIAYSKCKILKVISKKDWEQSPFTHKRFSENFVPQTFDYMDYKNAWYNTFSVRTSSHSWFFNWGEKLQKAFPNWFKNGGYFLVPLKIFFVLKSANPLTTSKPIVRTFSLQETVIHFPSVLNLEFLGFFVGN